MRFVRIGGGDKQRAAVSTWLQLPRVDDVDDVRFGRYRPVLAARTRMPALVPGVNVETKGCHARIISRHASERKADMELRNGFENPDPVTKLKVHKPALRQNSGDPVVHRSA